MKTLSILTMLLFVFILSPSNAEFDSDVGWGSEGDLENVYAGVYINDIWYENCATYSTHDLFIYNFEDFNITVSYEFKHSLLEFLDVDNTYESSTTVTPWDPEDEDREMGEGYFRDTENTQRFLDLTMYPQVDRDRWVTASVYTRIDAFGHRFGDLRQDNWHTENEEPEERMLSTFFYPPEPEE